MTSKWEAVRLGELADFQNGYPFKPAELGDEGLPVIRIKQLMDKNAEADRTQVEVPSRFHIGNGDIIFSWSGRIEAVRWERGRAVLNQHLYRVSVTDSRISDAFLLLSLQHLIPKLHLHGSTMKHVTKRELVKAEILVPPLAEQRRIVDLIGALDDAIEAAEEHVSNLGHAQMAAIGDALGKSIAPRVKMSDCFSYMIGGSWGSAPGVDSEEVLALGPSSFSGNAVNVNHELGSDRTLNSKRAAARSLQLGDIILERSGGSPTQPVGRVIRMKGGPSNIVPSDFMRLLRTDTERFNPDYLFWVLRSKYVRGESLGFQKFTTGIRNLNITDYLNGTTIPEETADNQDAFVELAESLQWTLDSAQDYAASLRALRTELLTALLSGAHEIPESYDSAMEMAGA